MDVKMTCRYCDKVRIGGVCGIDGHTIKDFDAECKVPEKKEIVFNCPPLNYSGNRNEQNT